LNYNFFSVSWKRKAQKNRWEDISMKKTSKRMSYRRRKSTELKRSWKESYFF